MASNAEAKSAETNKSPSAAADTQLFRAMAKADDGNPRLAPNHLGVRPGYDIPPDNDGNVKPATGGMSVTPNDPMDLPLHRRPPEFGGTGKWPVWWINDEKLPSILYYRPDPRSSTHGFIEPSDLMNLRAYVIGIEGTAQSWTLHG